MLTGDEKWVLHDTPKCARHWLLPQEIVLHSTRPPLPNAILYAVSGGLVAHYKLLPMGQIITGPVFAAVGTCQQTLKQELALVKRKDVLYCYANTRPCVAQVTRNTIQLWDTVLSTLLPWTLLPLPFPWQPPSWEIRHNWCRLSTSTHRLFCGQDTWFLPPSGWRHIYKRF